MPFTYPEKPLDRGKVLDAENVKELGAEWGRYKRRRRRRHSVPHAPGHRHAVVLHARIGPQRARRSTASVPTTTRDNVDRLARKHETAKQHVPAPDRRGRGSRDRDHRLRHQPLGDRRVPRRSSSRKPGIETAYMRLRAYPFPPEVEAFIARYKRVYLVEQNRDAQMIDAAAHRPAAGGDATTSAACCTTTACRSTRGRSPTTSWCRKGSKAPAPCRRGAARRGRRGRRARMIVDTTRRRNRQRRTASASRSQPYRGGKTTLCAGCGHNAISERIIDAFFEMGIHPRDVIKLSGIGCSSKTPAYFLGDAHGFNSVHGRMPSVGTGALLANRKMIAIGVSGDGDTGAIGIGQFVHLMRRNVPMVYIIEDNGCYGLTKGQFSPTADLGSTLKNGVVNDLPPIDTCMLAVQLGASFVARSFSGDKKQLLSILKAALAHRGTAMIDVISPCVTFNDHEGSTKSYAYAKEHDEPLGEVELRAVFRGHLRRVRPGHDDRGHDARRIEAVS